MELTNQNQSNHPEVMESDGVLSVPMVTSPMAAKALEMYLSDRDLVDKVTHLGKNAHVSGSSSYKLMRLHMQQKFSLHISDDSINNLFEFINKRGDLLRGAMARTAEESNFNKGIDTGLLMAFEDLVMEYEKVSTKLRSMPADDPQRPSIAKEARAARREMLDFKELISPAVQKMDMRSEINAVTNEANSALVAAVARLAK